MIICGFMLWGYPALPPNEAGEIIRITPWGQLGGAIIMFFVLGFIPTFIVAKILNAMGMLRIPKEVELAWLDYVENQASAADQEYSTSINSLGRTQSEEFRIVKKCMSKSPKMLT